MKTTCLRILLIITCWSTAAIAQIQLEPNDIFATGTYRMTSDKSTIIDPGTPGTDKIWAFNTLKNQSPFEFQITNMQLTGNGNEANLVKVNGTDTFEYILRTDTVIYQVMPLADFDIITYEKLKIFNIPFGYNHEIRDSVVKVLIHSGVKLNMPAYDSIRINFKTITNSKADSWGLLKLPMMEYNALRIKTEINNIARVEGKTGNQPYSPLPDFDVDEYILDYYWYAKDKGTYVATYNPESKTMQYLVSAMLTSPVISNEITEIEIVNPMDNLLQLNNPGKDTYHVVLYDLFGRVVLTESILAHENKSFETSAFFGNSFILALYNQQNKNIVHKKLIKN